MPTRNIRPTCTVQIIVFDLDGTIWDSERAIIETIFQTAAEAAIKISENEARKQFKNSVSPIAVLRHYGVSTESFWKKYKKNYANIQLFFSDTSEVLSTLMEREKKNWLYYLFKEGVCFESSQKIRALCQQFGEGKNRSLTKK